MLLVELARGRQRILIARAQARRATSRPRHGLIKDLVDTTYGYHRGPYRPPLIAYRCRHHRRCAERPGSYHERSCPPKHWTAISVSLLPSRMLGVSRKAIRTAHIVVVTTYRSQVTY